MPWCETCNRFLTPPTLNAAGECPTCGGTIIEPAVDPKAPWHFKLLIVALVIYLGWRVVQGVEWVIQRLT